MSSEECLQLDWLPGSLQLVDGTLCRCPSHLTHLLAHASSWEAATSTQGGEDVAGVEHWVAAGVKFTWHEYRPKKLTWGWKVGFWGVFVTETIIVYPWCRRSQRLEMMWKVLESLQLLLKCIYASLRILFWSLVLLLIIQCSAGMTISYMLSDYMVDANANPEARFQVFRYYGTFTKTLLTMFLGSTSQHIIIWMFIH